MKHPIRSLQEKLDQIVGALDEQAFFSFTAEEIGALHQEAEMLSQKLVSIGGSYLTIGLLGGTGVGKSTLMNSLAGSKIASVAHHRPLTDQALIYRHVETPLPSTLVSPDFPMKEVTHQADNIKQILLCDLPDFDSLMGGHRDYVINFLEHLDLLIWVTSPEKYADGRFYQFLHRVPKSSGNFYFVLNKADLLFEHESLENGYKQLAKVRARFAQHIQENGIQDPRLFSISAQQSLNSDQILPWNQLGDFRRDVFQQRDIKQIKAIKADNVDIEVQNLTKAFHRELANLKAFDEILETSIRTFHEQRAQWIKAGRSAIDLWMGQSIKQDVWTLQHDPAVLVGPGHALALMFQGWKKPITKKRALLSDSSLFTPPDAIRVSFQRRLEWFENRISQHILRRNLPSAFQERLEDVMDIPRIFEELGERFFSVVESHLAAPVMPSYRRFRLWQVISYLLLLGFFLLALVGETAWQEVINDPGAKNILQLVLSGIQTLFSTKGLAALISYILLNLFLGSRFYLRYRKRLRRSSQKTLDALRADMNKTWEMLLDEILDTMNHFREDIQSRMRAITSLRGDKGQNGALP